MRLSITHHPSPAAAEPSRELLLPVVPKSTFQRVVYTSARHLQGFDALDQVCVGGSHMWHTNIPGKFQSLTQPYHHGATTTQPRKTDPDSDAQSNRTLEC